MDYATELERLWQGEIEVLEIKPAEFMDFQAVFRDYAHRSQIKGIANRGGIIEYRLIEE